MLIFNLRCYLDYHLLEKKQALFVFYFYQKKKT